jgi:CTP:molybdopterin cytidylyltransferase MocA
VLRGLADVTMVETAPEELRDVDRPEDLADVEAISRQR